MNFFSTNIANFKIIAYLFCLFTKLADFDRITCVMVIILLFLKLENNSTSMM